MMSDGRVASPLIRKGQVVLGYDSAMDRERSARPIRHFQTCHPDVFRRHREGDCIGVYFSKN